LSQLSLELLIRIAVRAELPVVLQTGKDADQPGGFVAGRTPQVSWLLRCHVIGAMAAAVYGAIRATTDADALLSVSVARLGQLEKIFKKAGFATELRRGDADDPIPALLSVSDRSRMRMPCYPFPSPGSGSSKKYSRKRDLRRSCGAGMRTIPFPRCSQ